MYYCPILQGYGGYICTRFRLVFLLCYRGMEGKIPDDQSTDYARIPLIELPVSEEPRTATEADPEEGEGRQSCDT